MTNNKYYILVTLDGDKKYYKEIEGKPLTFYWCKGFDLFIHKNDQMLWTISDGITGKCIIGNFQTKKSIFRRLKEVLEQYGSELHGAIESSEDISPRYRKIEDENTSGFLFENTSNNSSFNQFLINHYSFTIFNRNSN